MSDTSPATTTDPDTTPPTTWHTCDDPDTCRRPHLLAVGYLHDTPTALALHASTPAAARTPTPRQPRHDAAAPNACVPAPAPDRL